MYNIYINEFLRDGHVQNVEEKIYEIPGYYPEEEMLDNPKVKNEMGKAGTFEFGMQPSNPWYSSLIQMRTRFRVEKDEETIFFGRVLSIDTDMYGKRTIHCEGALAFLLDTLMQSTKEEEREKITIVKYIEDLITSHNNLTEAWKNFEYGEIPGHYSASIRAEQKPDLDETKLDKYGTGSWTSILNCLEDLTSKHGGYLRARYENGHNYIDWLRFYYNPQKNNQPLKVGENIIDVSNTVDMNGIFTALIPEGTKNGKPLYMDDPRAYTVQVPVRRKKTTQTEGGETEQGEGGGS